MENSLERMTQFSLTMLYNSAKKEEPGVEFSALQHLHERDYLITEEKHLALPLCDTCEHIIGISCEARPVGTKVAAHPEVLRMENLDYFPR